MLKTFINNKSYSSSGLLKVSLPDLLAMNPTITEVTNVTLIATVSASTATRANFYIMPESTIPANCTTCRYVTQSSLTTTAQTFNLNVTEIFNTNRDAGKDYIYLRVSPLSNTNISITHIKLEITANCDVETNAVTYETFSKAYTSIEAGNMGKANVNLRDGNLSFGLSSMQFGGGSTSFNLSHVYRGVHCNSDEYYTSFHTKHGFGWKTNFHQYLIGSGEHAVYIDGQGNKHTFKKSNGKVYDDGGLGLTITSAGYCKKVYDDLGNTMHFARSGQLCRIDTALKKSYFIHYNNNDDIDYIENGDYKAQFTYNNNLLKKIAYIKISDNSEIENIQFEYTSNQLTKITKHVGDNSKTKAQFEYENGKLTKIYGGDYTYLKVEYSNTKVNKISTYSSDNNLLSYSSFNYNHSYGTAITNEAGVTYAYKIKANGELEKIYDMQSDSYGIQIHPTSNDKIETNTYLNNIRLDQVTSVTDTSTSTTVTFSSNGNFLTVDDVKASLYSLFKNNSTKLDFFYNNKRDRICNIPVSSCKINTDTTFSRDILSHKTYMYDNNNSRNLCVVTRETCESSGFKSETIYYASSASQEQIAELSSQTIVTDYITGQKISEIIDDAQTTYSYDTFGNLKKISKTNSLSNPILEVSSSYDAATGAYKTSDTDEKGHECTYEYYTPHNALKQISYEIGYPTRFTYNDFYDALRLVEFNTSTSNQLAHDIQTNDFGKITQVKVGETVYYFTYNTAGDLTKVTAGLESTPEANRMIVYEHNYNYIVNDSSNANIKRKETKISPINEYTISNETISYDKYGNIIQIDNGSKKATLTYKTPVTSKSTITKIEDEFADTETDFTTTTSGEKLFTCSGKTDNKLTWRKEENTKNNSSYITYNMGYNSGNYLDEVSYKRDIHNMAEGTKNSIQIVSSYTQNLNAFYCYYGQDSLKRLTDKTHNVPGCGGSYKTTYSYLRHDMTKTSNYVEVESQEIKYRKDCNEENPEKTITLERSYQYDKKGNLTKITADVLNGNTTTEKTIEYVYDNFGRIITEHNGLLNCSYAYTYNSNGNLYTKKKYSYGLTGGTALSTVDYEYDSIFPDLLTKHDGQDINYNRGYPTSYKGTSFRWDRGYLTNVDNGAITYTYDAFGRKVKKSYGTTAQYYYYDGNKLIGKDIYMGTVRKLSVRYLYDNDGICGLKVISDAGIMKFYHVTRDAFGNVTSVEYAGLSNNYIPTPVMTISYDAFGVPTYTQGSFHDSLFSTSTVMPFMYKGYYYDSDLGMYYLISRYYDPETGRFISPDDPNNMSLTQIGGISPYTYCFNNPVSNKIKLVESSSSDIQLSTTKSSISKVTGTLNDVAIIVDMANTILKEINNISSKADDLITLPPLNKNFGKIVFKSASASLSVITSLISFNDAYQQTNSISYGVLQVTASLGASYFSSMLFTSISALGGPITLLIGVAATILVNLILQDAFSSLAKNIYDTCKEFFNNIDNFFNEVF